MKFCENHRGELTWVLEGNGLGHLISKDRARALACLGEVAQKKVTPVNYDPSVVAQSEIIQKYMAARGPHAVALDQGTCPLCFCERNRAGLARNWIDGAVRREIKRARELSLIPLDIRPVEAEHVMRQVSTGTRN